MTSKSSRATLVLIVVLASGTMLGTGTGAEAATQLPNTGITLTKAAHQAGKLVITGSTRRAGQVVRLDNPARSKTSRANRFFRIVAPLLPGDCEIRLRVGARTDIVKVTACGPTGPQGIQGPIGPTGPSSISQAIPLFGNGGTVPALSGSYVFVGPTFTVPLATGQKIVASVSAPVITSASGDRNFTYGFCYQVGGAGAVINSAGSNFPVAQVPVGQSLVLASSSLMSGLAAGTYKVGTCIGNSSAYPVSISTVNGWVLVTN